MHARGVLVKQTNRSAAAVLHGSDVLAQGRADVFKVRERTRRRRLWRLIVILGLLDGYLWYRYLTNNPLQLPSLGPDMVIWLPFLLILLLIPMMVLLPMMSGRSPHVIVHPEEIEVGLDDVEGPRPGAGRGHQDPEPVPRLRDLPRPAGRQPAARASCSRARPAPARPTWPRRWPARPGCRSCSCRRPAFQSMYYGVTARKIRSFFKRAAQGGPPGGRRDRLHRGDRRHRRPPRRARAAARRHRSRPDRSSVGVVKRASAWSTSCCPDAVVRPPLGGRAMVGRLIDRVNRWLPSRPQIARAARKPAPTSW